MTANAYQQAAQAAIAKSLRHPGVTVYAYCDGRRFVASRNTTPAEAKAKYGFTHYRVYRDGREVAIDVGRDAPAVQPKPSAPSDLPFSRPARDYREFVAWVRTLEQQTGRKAVIGGRKFVEVASA